MEITLWEVASVKTLSRKLTLLAFRWVLSALLMNALTGVPAALLLAIWYELARDISMWRLLQQEFGGVFFRSMLGWLISLAIFPGLQISVLTFFRILVDRALTMNGREVIAGAQK